MGVGTGSLGKLVGGKVKYSDALDFNPHITHHFVLKERSLGPKKKRKEKKNTSSDSEMSFYTSWKAGE